MKKITFTILCVACGLATFAQVPNSGLETWLAPTGTYEEPEFWSTSNGSLALISAPANVSKATGADAYAGTASAKLETVAIFGGVGRASGALVSGNVNYVSFPSPNFEFSGGFPYTTRSGSLTGYYKYTSIANDSARFMAILTKSNGMGGRDTIATGVAHPKTTTTGYERFEVPLVYSSATEIPDTALIILLSSNGIITGGAGTTLYLDDINFEFNAGVNGIEAHQQVKVYPNPAQNRMMIDVIPGQFSSAKIFDLTGRLVTTMTVNGNSIDVSNLKDGQYIIELHNRSKTLRSTFAKQ